MSRAPAARRRRDKRHIDGARRTNSPTSRRRLAGPSHFLAVRPFSLRFALTTAPHRPRKRRPDVASHPAPCSRRRSSRAVVPLHFPALRPFVLHYFLAVGASASCRRRKASLIDMGGKISRLLDGGLRLNKRRVDESREVGMGNLSTNELQLDKASAARSGIHDASNIPLEEAPSYKEDLSELFTPLTNEEESEVDNSLYGIGHSKDILVLHEPSNIEITKDKLGCLRPRAWLNDEVINLYLELLKERAEREPNRFLKCHFFNTFFYKKIKERVPRPLHQSMHTAIPPYLHGHSP